MNSTYLLVGLGGAVGAIARVVLSRILPSFVLGMPAKILFVNILGCFLIGLLTGIMTFYWSASINMRHFLVQGFLGGFTTFSAFALEFGLLHEKGTTVLAIVYAILSVVLSLTFFFIGLKIIRYFLESLHSISIKDRIFETIFKDKIEYIAGKIILILASIVLDVLTFPFRLVTFIPRIISNYLKEPIPFHKYLIEQKVDTKLFEAKKLEVQFSCHIDRDNYTTTKDIDFVEIPVLEEGTPPPENFVFNQDSKHDLLKKLEGTS